MEIKLELDTKKPVKATITITCTYGLCGVSEATASPQLAAIPLIVIVAILYSPCLAPTKSA